MNFLSKMGAFTVLEGIFKNNWRSQKLPVVAGCLVVHFYTFANQKCLYRQTQTAGN